MIPHLFSEHSVFFQPTTPPTPAVIKEEGRIMGIIWLIFTFACCMSLAVFYSAIFVILGVPTESFLSAYSCLVVLNVLILIALTIGIHCMLSRTVLSTIPALTYNIYMGFIMVLAIAIMILFAHDAPVAELTKFLSNDHAGAHTFVHYLETKLNCCGLISNKSQLYYQYEINAHESNSTVKYVLGMCPENNNKPGCLDNITTFSDVFKLHEDIKNIFLLQEFLPIFLLLEIVVILLLFNTYIKDFSEESNSNETDEGPSEPESSNGQEESEIRPTTSRTHVFFECPRSSRSRSRSPSFSNTRLSLVSELFPGGNQSDDEDAEENIW